MEKTLFQLGRSQKKAEKDNKQGTEALFNVAEIYLFILGEVDSALSAYNRILERSDSSATPKALYGIALIHADSLHNQEKADQIFKQLVDEYPITPFAVDARRRIGLERSDDVLAEARFIEAEDLKAEGADPNDVVTILRQVTDEYPNSLYAPKALWTYENDLDDIETASVHYKRLIQSYPMTDFAKVSEDKIKHIAKELRLLKREKDSKAKNRKRKSAGAKASKGEKKRDTTPELETDAQASNEGKASGAPKPSKDPVSTDDVSPLAAGQSTAPPQTNASKSEPKIDTNDGPLEADQIDQLPTLKTAPPPESRDELEEEGIDPTVTVRILVDKRGRVKRVIVVEGAEVLEEAAVDAAFEFLFEPGMHQGKPREVWMEFPITFVSPGQADGGEEEPR